MYESEYESEYENGYENGYKSRYEQYTLSSAILTDVLARQQQLNVTSSLARTRDLMSATGTKLGSKACEQNNAHESNTVFYVLDPWSGPGMTASERPCMRVGMKVNMKVDMKV